MTDRADSALIAVMEDDVTRAHDLARREHAGQRYGEHDYYTAHLSPVAARLAAYGPDMENAGVLHDLLEDTDVSVAMLRSEGFPERSIAAILAVTRQSGESYHLIARAASHLDSARVKYADNRSNWDNLSTVSDNALRERLTEKYRNAAVVLERALERLSDDV